MSDKVIVITGGSSGIGAAVAQQLARTGDRVVLAARDMRRLAAAAARCGDRATYVCADVTKREDLVRLRDQALALCGRIDVWINNAGRGITREVLELSDADLDEMFLINTKSAVYGMQTIVPYFKARGHGHVINISSLLSRVPAAPYRSAYSAAKAALNILTANLRMNLQLTHPQIYVSLVLPGAVPTAFHENAIGGFSPPSGMSAPQTPEDVARVVANVIDEPQAEVYSKPEFPELVERYLRNVSEFESLVATPSRPAFRE